MKLLLTSAGISNKSIRNALIDLLGKPIEESKALFIPTAIYGISDSAEIIRKVICGTLGDPFCDAGWKSLGLLELTALSTICLYFNSFCKPGYISCKPSSYKHNQYTA